MRPSHTYNFQWRDLARLVVLPLAPLGLFAAAMHVSVAVHILPPPRPTLDIDRTILLHQADASRSRHESEVLLIGDSSCLMDASATQLTDLLGRDALDLGTVSYLALPDYAVMLAHYELANPGRARAVVVLLHPESLRRVAPETYHVNLLKAFYANADGGQQMGFYNRISWMSGLEIFKGRLWTRLVPTPLPGDYGSYYGFSADLWRYLSRHKGSAVDPGRFVSQAGQGNAEYRLARQLEIASRTFKDAVPNRVKLIVGITPAPEGFVAPNYQQRHAQMLNEWSRWMEADIVLTNLPPALPDRFFASPTHLNEAGAQVYSAILARSLKPHL